MLLVAAATWPAAGQERYRLEGEQWLKQVDLDPASPEGQLQAIRKALAQDQPRRAQELADQWIKRYPNHHLLGEAYLLRGDAKVARGNHYEALYDYEYLIRSYPASEHFLTALEREYHIASLFERGLKRKFWGIFRLSAEDEAEELLIRIQERAPGSQVGEKASIALGDFYFNRADMRQAAEAYDLFLLNYPESPFRERAMLQLIRASLATFKGPRFDATGLIEASQRIRLYQKEYPAAAERLGVEAILVRVDESLALKSYYNGRWYEQTDKDVSAVYTYQRVVRDHPQTAAAQLALDRMASLGATVDPTIGGPSQAPELQAPPPDQTVTDDLPDLDVQEVAP